MVANCSRNDLEYVLIAIFILSIGIPFYNKINTLINIPFLPNKIGLYSQIGECFWYYLVGYYLATYKFSTKINHIIYGLGFLSILFTIFGTFWIVIVKNYNVDTFRGLANPNIAMASIAAFVFVKNYFENKTIPNVIRKIASKIAKRSFGIYLIHAFTIILINHYFGLMWDICSPLFSVPLIAILVFLLSFLVSLGISKIPVLKNYIV
jgi:surface polysaccharide O-acyltransferase-like enzyme